MDITAATSEQFDAFLTQRGRVISGDKSVLLVESLDFLSTVDICKEGDTYVAQCHIAWVMSAEGGAFDPAAIVSGQRLTKKGLGRGAIVKEFEDNSELSGTDSISILKRIPAAYGILKPLLCAGGSSAVELAR